VRSKEFAQELCGVAPRDAVPDRERGHRRLQARAEGSWGNSGWQRGARLASTLRTTQAMQAVLGHRDRDGGQFGHLVALWRSRVPALVRGEAVRAGVAARRPVVEDLVYPLEGQQRALLAFVSGLTAGTATGDRSSRARWRRGGIKRRRQRRIARGAVQLPLKIGHAGLKPPVCLDQFVEAQQQGNRGLPVAVENRLCLGTVHGVRVRRTREGSCSPTDQGDLNGYSL
jgi:hypothetical protein